MALNNMHNFHRGTEIGKGDQFCQPKVVRGTSFGGGPIFSGFAKLTLLDVESRDTTG